MKFTVEAINFEEFIEYGKSAPDANIVNGEPWSFAFSGYPVTQENSECYLISTPDEMLKFTPNEVILTGDNGKVYMINKETFNEIIIAYTK